MDRLVHQLTAFLTLVAPRDVELAKKHGSNGEVYRILGLGHESEPQPKSEPLPIGVFSCVEVPLRRGHLATFVSGHALPSDSVS
jgi:hypothetical protein